MRTLLDADAPIGTFESLDTYLTEDTLLLDGANALQGIVGVYWLTDFGSRSPVMLFSQSYRRRMGGVCEPEFAETRLGRYTMSDARFQTERVESTWKEVAGEGQRQVKIHLQGR